MMSYVRGQMLLVRTGVYLDGKRREVVAARHQCIAIGLWIASVLLPLSSACGSVVKGEDIMKCAIMY